MLANLIGNAVKFTPAGEIEVTVQAERRPEDEAGAPGAAGALPSRAWLLSFAVRDTGVGIAPAERGKLFKPFSQVDSTTTRKYGGAGLGLAISQSLAQMMGGEISVESEVGRGTTFTFTMVADEVPAEGPAPGLGDQTFLTGRTLAVVSAAPSLRRDVLSWAFRLAAMLPLAVPPLSGHSLDLPGRPRTPLGKYTTSALAGMARCPANARESTFLNK